MDIAKVVRRIVTPYAPLDICTPDELETDVASVDYVALKAEGYRLVIFDVDGTLTRFHAQDPEPEAYIAVAELKTLEMSVCGLSNGMSDRRRAVLESKLHIPIFEANPPKPNRLAVRAVFDYFDPTIKTDECMIIGDRLLTDIVLGNSLRMHTVLVRPFAGDKDSLTVSIGRLYESSFYGDAIKPEMILHFNPNITNHIL